MRSRQWGPGPPQSSGDSRPPAPAIRLRIPPVPNRLKCPPPPTEGWYTQVSVQWRSEPICRGAQPAWSTQLSLCVHTQGVEPSHTHRGTHRSLGLAEWPMGPADVARKQGLAQPLTASLCRQLAGKVRESRAVVALQPARQGGEGKETLLRAPPGPLCKHPNAYQSQTRFPAVSFSVLRYTYRGMGHAGVEEAEGCGRNRAVQSPAPECNAGTTSPFESAARSRCREPRRCCCLDRRPGGLRATSPCGTWELLSGGGGQEGNDHGAKGPNSSLYRAIS